MSWPAIASGTVAIWIGNGCVMPWALSALARAGAMPRSRKVVVTSVNGVVVGGSAVGGGTDKVFYENDITITTSYTIGTNKNAMTAGPITINSGVTVTVPSGSVWSII